MKNILFTLLLSVGIFITASERKLVVMEKTINFSILQRPIEVQGYTISRYDNVTLDPSAEGFAELWNNPRIIADAGYFMVVPENQIWVLRDDSNPKSIASCIRFGVLDDCGYIDQLATHQNYQGHGLAKKLMQEAELFCITHGCSSLRLSVYNNNIPAMSFYKKIGFDACN
jgi:ribosomal protein S18 acetylase RimI-like enzyme